MKHIHRFNLGWPGKSTDCFFILLFIVLGFPACKEGKGPGSRNREADSVAIREAFSSAPVVSPEESIQKMKLEDGFVVQLIAAEPLVISPVALTFDEKGRMWVAEMEGYMPDTLGHGEDQPTGKIVILSDTNKDGVMDKRDIFMDSLVLPRALCLVEDGILIAEPPTLSFVQIINDHPGKTEMVDDKYTQGGNVEHQPNGLFRALDNWIYSANSGKRYRKNGNKWLIERTHSRGQWGISQDDYGRLFYNNNSQNLLGDYFSPGLGASNENQRRVVGFNEKIIPDNKVYPARPTTGVNRGYMEGVLDDSLRLVNFTAASGPVIYRGGLFGKEYELNAFVAEPAAYLIKRNIIEEKGNLVKGKQAYSGKEFLTSTDERFRPVTLYNGPDGALYIVDMYRGVIQHKTYLTEYLKGEIRTRQLEHPLNCGRIYKIVPRNKETNVVTLPGNPAELVELLKHSNGWVRDKAQQMLVDGKYQQAVPALRQLLAQTDHPVTVAHALWALEGMGALVPADILPLLKQPLWDVRMQALSVLPSAMTKSTYRQYLPSLQQMVDEKDTLAAPYVAFLLQKIESFDKGAGNQLLLTVVKQYPDNIFVSDALISNLKGRESAFMKQLLALNPDTSLAIRKQLQKVLFNISDTKSSANKKNLEKEFPEGSAVFVSVCQGCHGADGNGIRSLAPPLNHSEWVLGDKEKLIPIVLFGLTGPVKVSGTLYQVPEITGDMPGIGNNKELTDEDIAQLLSFIRKSWSNQADKITPTDVSNTRKKFKGRQKAFTMQEVMKLK